MPQCQMARVFNKHLNAIKYNATFINNMTVRRESLVSDSYQRHKINVIGPGVRTGIHIFHEIPNGIHISFP